MKVSSREPNLKNHSKRWFHNLKVTNNNFWRSSSCKIRWWWISNGLKVWSRSYDKISSRNKRWRTLDIWWQRSWSRGYSCKSHSRSFEVWFTSRWISCEIFKSWSLPWKILIPFTHTWELIRENIKAFDE